MIEKLITEINTEFDSEMSKGLVTTFCIIALLNNLFQDNLTDKVNLLKAIKEQLFEEDQNKPL